MIEDENNKVFELYNRKSDIVRCPYGRAIVREKLDSYAQDEFLKYVNEYYVDNEGWMNVRRFMWDTFDNFKNASKGYEEIKDYITYTTGKEEYVIPYAKDKDKYDLIIMWLSLRFVHLMVSSSYLTDIKFSIFLGLMINYIKNRKYYKTNT